MKRIEFIVDGRSVRVFAQRIQGALWFHYSGRTYCIERAESRHRSGRSVSGRANPGQIHAPMPGKVTKVLVSPGGMVAQGVALVVMEAMKMEYTLSSDIDGSVERVDCKPGDQVELGKLLVSVTPSEPEAVNEG